MSVNERIVSGRKKWEVRWRENNQNRSRTFDLQKDAKAYDRELRRLRQAGEFDLEMQRRRVTVADLIGEWRERSLPSLSAKAAQTYALQIKNRIRPTFGARRVAQITVADVENWIAQMRTSGDRDPTILKAVTVLQALLTLAVRDGIVSVNVAQQARKPAQGRTRVPYIVQPASVEVMRLRMQRAGRERDVMLLDLLAYAGLRPESEAVALTWGMIRERSILVRDTKRHRERSVKIVEPLAESLGRWRVRCGNPDATSLVIPTYVIGEPWTEDDWRSWRRNRFRPAAVAAGLPIDVRPRDLRGSFVSLLLQSGSTIVEVARQVGHSPAICLRDYAQVIDEIDPFNRRSVVEIIDEARAAAPAFLDEKFASSSHGSDSITEVA